MIKQLLGLEKKNDQLRRAVNHENNIIEYTINYQSRKTLTIMIKQPNGEVVVKSPKGLTISYIEEFVSRKADWIIKHKSRINSLNQIRIRKEYTDGAVHLFLGKQYVLEVYLSNSESVEMIDDKIVVKSKNESRVEQLLKVWYANLSTQIFSDICRPLINSFAERNGGVYPSRLEAKYVKGYWGQCTPQKVIRLNIELLRAPRECIEYIMVHELCHLVHHNHSKDFWDLVKQELSDYKERKLLLDKTIGIRD